MDGDEPGDPNRERAADGDGARTGESAPASEAPAGSDGAGPTRDRSDPEAVADRYDFEDFGPREFREMSPEEWEAAFDPDSWVTGPELLDRVEADLEARIADGEVFAALERQVHGSETATDGEGASTAAGEDASTEPGPAARAPPASPGDERLLAYSDEGYAYVYADGTVEGRGTVLRDVKPSVALCSMAEYEVQESAGSGLPEPGPAGDSSQLGNRVLLVVGAAQALAGAMLLGAWILAGLNVVAAIAGVGFLAFGTFLLVVVANARLSGRFRAAQFRERLQATGGEGRPEVVPEDGPWRTRGGDE